MTYEVSCKGCGEFEIEKPMAAQLPRCPYCHGTLRRVYDAMPAVHYAAPGFYATDVKRGEDLFGKDRAARFNRQKADAEARAKSGRLTPYERKLEAIA